MLAIRCYARFTSSGLQSWAYWSFKSFNDITTSGDPNAEGFFHADGSLQADKIQALVRPYSPAVAGVPVKLAFDVRSRV